MIKSRSFSTLFQPNFRDPYLGVLGISGFMFANYDLTCLKCTNVSLLLFLKHVCGFVKQLFVWLTQLINLSTFRNQLKFRRTILERFWMKLTERCIPRQIIILFGTKQSNKNRLKSTHYASLTGKKLKMEMINIELRHTPKVVDSR